MQVYISHASADRELAERLAARLRDAEIDVWDPATILPGDNWALETGRALEQSEVMVVLFTKNARGNPRLSQDVQYALTQGNYQGRVVPAFVGFSVVEAGKDVPWILLRLDPIWLGEDPVDLAVIVARVRAQIESGCNASA